MIFAETVEEVLERVESGPLLGRPGVLSGDQAYKVNLSA